MTTSQSVTSREVVDARNVGDGAAARIALGGAFRLATDEGNLNGSTRVATRTEHISHRNRVYSELGGGVL